MVKVAAALRAHRLATTAVVLGFVGILTGAALGWSGKFKYRQGPDVLIVSKTVAVTVLWAEKTMLGTAPILAVKLQNTSGKAIKAFTISSGKTWVTQSYFMIEESFAPGTIVNQFIPLSSDASQDYKITFGNGREISVSAVFFADGTGDGDSHYVRMLADQRAGIRDQANRILPHLRQLSSKSVLDPDQALTTCEAEILRLPTKQDRQASGDYETGLEDAQRELLNRLNEIKEEKRTHRLPEAAAKQEKLTRVFQSLAN